MSNKQVITLYERFFNVLNVLKYNDCKIDCKKHKINKWIKQYCDKHYNIYKLNIEDNYIIYVIYKILTFVNIPAHPYLSKYHHLYNKKMKEVLFGSNSGCRNECELLIKEHSKYKKNIILNTEKLLFY